MIATTATWISIYATFLWCLISLQKNIAVQNRKILNLLLLLKVLSEVTTAKRDNNTICLINWSIGGRAVNHEIWLDNQSVTFPCLSLLPPNWSSLQWWSQLAIWECSALGYSTSIESESSIPRKCSKQKGQLRQSTEGFVKRKSLKIMTSLEGVCYGWELF